MELTAEVCAILTPAEMRTLRKTHAGMTLATLSRLSGVSVPQLSRFETGRNGLRIDQAQTCRRILLAAAAERSQMISTLFGTGGEKAAESMSEAS